MFDTTIELVEKIRLGEDSFLELKEVRFSGGKVKGPTRDDLADEIAAFANSRRGGVCVLGVEDKTRDVTGIPMQNLDAVETFVRDICNDAIKPPVAPVIERRTLPTVAGTDVPVIRIDIAPSLFVHRSPGGYLHRLGSSKREMPPDYLARLFQQRSQANAIRFDEQVVAGARLEDLTERLWRRFATPLSGTEAPEVFLDKLGMARKDEAGEYRPTVAGVLLATSTPREFLPNAFIQAVAYRYETAAGEGAEGYQLDAKDITGPIDEQVAQALRFVARNMKMRATKTIGRMDHPQYDLGAVMEAVTNAVAHRDYSIHGSKIRLQMFSDRLELYSPGALANTMTVESLSARQAARNEVLTSMMARCSVPGDIEGLITDRRTLMDKRGEGVGIIVSRTLALSGKKPEFRMIDDQELLLTIYAAE